MTRSLQPDRLWSVDDVSAFLGVPVETLYQWRKRHYGPRAGRVGRHLRLKLANRGLRRSLRLLKRTDRRTVLLDR